MNAVIKRLMEWKQAPLDATVLAFNYLQKFYVHEIMRGLCNVGNYCLKQIHIGASADKGDVIFPTEICAPEKIIDLVRGKLAEETTHSVEDDKDSKLPHNATVIEEDKKTCSTQRSLAIAAVKEKRVFHVPEAGSFVVKGSKGDNYSVTLYPEKCQCPSIGTCYHIMAVKMSIGEEDIEEKSKDSKSNTVEKEQQKKGQQESRNQKTKAMRPRYLNYSGPRFGSEKKSRMG